MLALKRIVLATDFSPCAEAALRYAAVLARMTQAELLLTHVIDTRVVALPRWTDIFRSTEVFAAMEAAETEAMQQLLARPLLKDLPVRPEVLRGHPVDRLIDVAAFADLAVLGTHGRSAERGKPAGTVARHVAHGSATPTLLVPPGGGTAGLPAEDAQRLDMRRVLLAIHFAQYAPQALALARDFALASQGELLALQVIEPDKVASYPLELGKGLYRNLDGVKSVLQKRLAEIVPDDPDWPPVQRLVRTGQAAATILEQAREYGADLIVMSVHPYGALRRFFVTSTLDAVLAATPCPVLAVPFPRPVVP